MTRTIVSALLFCLLLSSLTEFAQAGLIISILNTHVQPGSSGFVDVMIRSNSNDTLSNYSINLQIQQVGTTVSQLRFSPLQSDAQLSNPNYVFAAGSLKRDGDPSLLIDPQAVGSTSTNIYPRDMFVGTDSYTLQAPPSVTLTSNDLLLARLNLESAPGFLGTAEGDQFRVILVDGPFTSFLSEDLSELSYTKTLGLVNITAVPEPTSCFSALVGMMVAYRQFRRRRAVR